jgi:DNA-binding CsgD family transcriptional regulator
VAALHWRSDTPQKVVNPEVTVPAAKVRRILQIAHEAHEIEGHEARLRHALSGVCELVGADVGVIFVFRSPDASVPALGVMQGYSPERAPAVMGEYAARGDRFDLMAQRMRASFDGSTPVLARRRQELVDDRSWYNSEYVNEFRRRWGFDHSIYSMLSTGAMHVGMSVNRSFGGSPFETADQTLVEIFHLAVARVAAQSIPRSATLSHDARRAALAPRVSDTLDCLLRGASNKDIAEELQLSPNTVHHYTKIIFRAFGVRSRSELLAGWFASR